MLQVSMTCSSQAEYTLSKFTRSPIIRDLANRDDPLHTVRTQLDIARKERTASVPVQVRINKRWLDDALLALCSLQQALREPCSGHCHGKRGRAGAALGLDDFIATKLHSTHVVVQLFTLKIVAALRKEWDDGSAGVASNNGDVLVRRISAFDLGNEATRADDVERGYTKQTLRIVDTSAFVYLGGDGDGAVDGVGDDEHVGFRRMIGGSFGKIADDGGVGIEEV